jgi:GMP reductase
MPRIDNDVKLDFKDVLIRPKRSTLKSRSDVDLIREYTFVHSKRKYLGVPIMAANMDTVGIFSVATEMAKVRTPILLFSDSIICSANFYKDGYG